MAGTLAQRYLLVGIIRSKDHSWPMTRKAQKQQYFVHFLHGLLFFSPHVVSQTEAGVEIRGGRQIAVSEVVPPEAPGSRR